MCSLKLVIRALGGKYNLHSRECLINGIHGFNFLRPPPTVCCWAAMELFTSLNLTVRGFVVVTIITFQILHADEMSGVEVETI